MSEPSPLKVGSIWIGAMPCGATERLMPEAPTPKVMVTEGHVPVRGVVSEIVPPGLTWRRLSMDAVSERASTPPMGAVVERVMTAGLLPAAVSWNPAGRVKPGPAGNPASELSCWKRVLSLNPSKPPLPSPREEGAEVELPVLEKKLSSGPTRKPGPVRASMIAPAAEEKRRRGSASLRTVFMVAESGGSAMGASQGGAARVSFPAL
jgi:hypothetical protein